MTTYNNMTQAVYWNDVADSTALAAIVVSQTEVGGLAHKIDDDTLWKAVKAGSGATCWRLDASNYRDGIGVVTLTDAATIALDLSQGNLYQVTLGGNRTLGLATNGVIGKSYILKVIQDGTGSRTLALATGYYTAGGTYTPTATADHYDYVRITCLTATTFLFEEGIAVDASSA